MPNTKSNCSLLIFHCSLGEPSGFRTIFKNMVYTVMNMDWKSPNEVKRAYANASILKDNRIVFNIKGNSYRLVAKFNFEKKWIFIRFIGTHSEYNQIDANKI